MSQSSHLVRCAAFHVAIASDKSGFWFFVRYVWQGVKCIAETSFCTTCTKRSSVFLQTSNIFQSTNFEKLLTFNALYIIIIKLDMR